MFDGTKEKTACFESELRACRNQLGEPKIFLGHRLGGACADLRCIFKCIMIRVGTKPTQPFQQMPN